MSQFNFKDTISLATGKFLNFQDINNVRKDIIGIGSGNTLFVRNGGGDIIVNDGSDSKTLINTNNSEPVVVGSKLSIGTTVASNLITLANNNFIGMSTKDGYIGIVAGDSPSSTSGSRITLFGDNNGQLSLAAGPTGSIKMITSNATRLEVFSSGDVSISPDGTNQRIVVSDNTFDINTEDTLFHSVKNATCVTSGGAVTVKGGASIQKDLYVGGVLYVDDLASFKMSSDIMSTAQLLLRDTTDAVSVSQGGSLTISGGAAIQKTMFVGGNIAMSKNTFRFSGGTTHLVDEVSGANIEGLLFDQVLVRSFTASIGIRVILSTFERQYMSVTLSGTQSGTTSSGWLSTVHSMGDSLPYTFSLAVSNGKAQVRYTSGGVTNFSSISFTYVVDCITNITETVTLPTPADTSTFNIYPDGIQPHGLIRFDADGGTIISDDTFTFDTTDMVIKGNIVPYSNVSYNLGSPTNKWNDLFLSGSTIYLGETRISSENQSIRFVSTKTTDPCPVSMRVDGNVICGLGHLIASDERLKTQIQEVNTRKSLDVLRELCPKEFKYTSDLEHKKVGFVAQDVEKVFPDAVRQTKTSNCLITRGCISGDVLTIDEDVIDYKQYGNQSVTVCCEGDGHDMYITILEKIQHKTFRIIPMGRVDGQVSVKVTYVTETKHLDAESIYAVAVSAVKELDAQFQTERRQHLETQRKLKSLEKRLEDALEYIRSSIQRWS